MAMPVLNYSKVMLSTGQSASVLQCVIPFCNAFLLSLVIVNVFIVYIWVFPSGQRLLDKQSRLFCMAVCFCSEHIVFKAHVSLFFRLNDCRALCLRVRVPNGYVFMLMSLYTGLSAWVFIVLSWPLVITIQRIYTWTQCYKENVLFIDKEWLQGVYQAHLISVTIITFTVPKNWIGHWIQNKTKCMK